MKEIDAHFDAYEHLKHLPREREALHMLRKAASMVKPMMRKRGWKVKTLGEFLPDEPRLLGLNINRVDRILVRLRYHYDARQFLPMEEIMDTLLHELAHILWGPHDVNFHNLWNELRDEHAVLLVKGYTGEGFLSQGQKLGGKRIPLDEMRRQARIAAEKRQATSNPSTRGGGHRLGGSRPTQRGADMRKVIADAASRRISITDGCASGSANAGKLVNQQEQNGFRTTAEQDDANDWAIAQALQDLMYDEEMQRLGRPTGNGGLAWDPENGLSFDRNPSSESSAMQQPTRGTERLQALQGRPVSRLVTQLSSKPSRPSSSSSSSSASSKAHSSRSRPASEAELRRNKTLPPTPPRLSTTRSPRPPHTVSQVEVEKEEWKSSSRPLEPPSSSSTPPPPATHITPPTHWPCPQCTLDNPLTHLACSLCGIEQPPQPIPPSRRFASSSSSSSSSLSYNTPNLPKPPPKKDLRGVGATTPFEPARGRLGWNCLECGTFMETQWWTCSCCGGMKAES